MFYLHMYALYSTLIHLPPLRFHCLASEDTGIERKTVVFLALAARRSTTRLDLIHSLYGNKILLSQVDDLYRRAGCGYQLSSEKYHEAGYDAYVTGLCFLSMARRLAKLCGAPDAG
jgi:hypothetical protein